MSYNRPGRAQPRRQHPSRRRRRRGGFTLVEILTAVAIIAILVSMAFLGFKYASAGPKQKLAETTLHNVRGMLAEYESSGGRMKDLLAAYNNTATPPVAQPLPLTVPNPPEAIDPEDLKKYNLAKTPAPALGAPYYEIYATAYKVMPRLRAVPANKSVLDALPTDHVYPRAWTATKDPTAKAPFTSGDMRSYAAGERVQSANGFYICKSDYTVDTGGGKPPELDAGHWDVDDPNFLVLDAWGSPIIFVPPLGVVNLTVGGEKPGDAGAITHVAMPSGANQLPPKQATDRKGYFMSAGPDRKYWTGDDNVYSFENK